MCVSGRKLLRRRLSRRRRSASACRSRRWRRGRRQRHRIARLGAAAADLRAAAAHPTGSRRGRDRAPSPVRPADSRPPDSAPPRPARRPRLATRATVVCTSSAIATKRSMRAAGSSAAARAGHEIAAMRGEPRGERRRRLAPATGRASARARMPAENVVARALMCRPLRCRSAHRLMKLRPSGAGMSRTMRPAAGQRQARNRPRGAADPAEQPRLDLDQRDGRAPAASRDPGPQLEPAAISRRRRAAARIRARANAASSSAAGSCTGQTLFAAAAEGRGVGQMAGLVRRRSAPGSAPRPSARDRPSHRRGRRPRHRPGNG